MERRGRSRNAIYQTIEDMKKSLFDLQHKPLERENFNPNQLQIEFPTPTNHRHHKSPAAIGGKLLLADKQSPNMRLSFGPIEVENDKEIYKEDAKLTVVLEEAAEVANIEKGRIPINESPIHGSGGIERKFESEFNPHPYPPAIFEREPSPEKDNYNISEYLGKLIYPKENNITPRECSEVVEMFKGIQDIKDLNDIEDLNDINDIEDLNDIEDPNDRKPPHPKTPNINIDFSPLQGGYVFGFGHTPVKFEKPPSSEDENIMTTPCRSLRIARDRHKIRKSIEGWSGKKRKRSLFERQGNEHYLQYPRTIIQEEEEMEMSNMSNKKKFRYRDIL